MMEAREEEEAMVPRVNSLSSPAMRPAFMLAGMAISILAGRGIVLRFMISTNVSLSVERFSRSLNLFSSPIVEDTLP